MLNFQAIGLSVVSWTFLHPHANCQVSYKVMHTKKQYQKARCPFIKAIVRDGLFDNTGYARCRKLKKIIGFRQDCSYLWKKEPKTSTHINITTFLTAHITYFITWGVLWLIGTIELQKTTPSSYMQRLADLCVLCRVGIWEWLIRCLRFTINRLR